tara:strand:+ start:760 stop:939 length:180 start_codon:yes stop_codon:yes gene_type:complete
MSLRYQQPRPVLKDDGGDSVFNDKRTGRKVYNNYTGNVFKNPTGVRTFMKEMRKYKKKI